MGRSRSGIRAECQVVALPIWQELLAGVEMLSLRISPVYWGMCVPKGDGSAVVVVPCFLGNDVYLADLRFWLKRIGYRPYHSGIRWNAECPNLLVRQSLALKIEHAYHTTHKKVHLLGHSLGGVMALAAATQAPDLVASVITMGSPFGGVSAHTYILQAADAVRTRILRRHGDAVLPACYTPACTCAFAESVAQKFPRRIARTAIYSKADGIVDWHVCRTGDPNIDIEVASTHIGMAFSPSVYQVIGRRLGEAVRSISTPERAAPPATTASSSARKTLVTIRATARSASGTGPRSSAAR